MAESEVQQDGESPGGGDGRGDENDDAEKQNGSEKKTERESDVFFYCCGGAGEDPSLGWGFGSDSGSGYESVVRDGAVKICDLARDRGGYGDEEAPCCKFFVFNKKNEGSECLRERFLRCAVEKRWSAKKSCNLKDHVLGCEDDRLNKCRESCRIVSIWSTAKILMGNIVSWLSENLSYV